MTLRNGKGHREDGASPSATTRLTDGSPGQTDDGAPHLCPLVHQAHLGRLDALLSGKGRYLPAGFMADRWSELACSWAQRVTWRQFLLARCEFFGPIGRTKW